MDGSLLFSKEFEIIILGVLAIVTIMLFTGHGEFATKQKNSLKKRTREEELRMQRRLGSVTGFWLVAEILLYFFGEYLWVDILYIVVLIISIVYLVKFFSNNN